MEMERSITSSLYLLRCIDTGSKGTSTYTKYFSILIRITVGEFSFHVDAGDSGLH